MAKTIKILALTNGTCLLSEIDEVAALDIGQPDCKLTNPFVIEEHEGSHDFRLSPFLLNLTLDEAFMMGSDKILTICEPTPTLKQKWDMLVEKKPIT